jgi:proteasome lid subunit RPN8/RPN11
MDVLALDRAALDEMLAHARATHPEECCGAVITRDGKDHVLRFTNIQNRLHEQFPDQYPRTAERAYTPEPKDQFAAERAGREPGARLSVLYHSHPVTGAYFSGEDRARALFDGEPAYPEVTWVVVSDARTRGEARAFRWSDGAQDFLEVAIEVREP